MRHSIVASLFLLSLVVAQPGDAAKPKSAELSQAERARVGKLVEQLGSSSYDEREQAAEDLEACGAAALPFLREAARAADAEVSRRATLIVASIEEKLLTASLLAPRRFRLAVHEVTAAAAVEELSRASGYPVRLEGTTPDRRITLDTGETTFWDAVKQLCRKAELVEKPPPAPEPPAGTTGITMARKLRQVMAPAGTTLESLRPLPLTPLVLVGGTVKELPTCAIGSVRVRALPAATSAAHETRIVLEVTAEPRLGKFGVIALQRFEHAIDDRGQQVAIAAGPYPSAVAPSSHATGAAMAVGNVMINGNRIVINGGNVIVNGRAVSGPAASPALARTITIGLDKTEKTTSRLREISGVLLVQGLSEPETLVTVDKIFDAAYRVVKAADGRTLEIRTVARQPNGDIHIRATGSNSNGTNAGGLLGANIIINGINLNGLNVGGVEPLTRCQPRLLDAAGKEYTLTGISDDHYETVNGQAAHAITYYFRPQASEASPAQLIVSSQRLVTFRVPFTLKDVPLP